MMAPLRLAVLALLPLGACAPLPAEPPAARFAFGTEPPPAVQRTAAPRPVQAPQRLAPMFDQPLGLWLGNPAPARIEEAAPLPNRNIEAPRRREADSLAPSIEPMMLPPERRQGATFGAEHLRETGPDRPLDNFMPGARLRIPFESAPGR